MRMGTFPKGKIRVIRVLCGEAIGIFCDYLLIEFLYYCFQRFIAVVIAGDSRRLVFLPDKSAPVINTLFHCFHNQMPFLLGGQLDQHVSGSDQRIPAEQFLMDLVQPYFQSLYVAVQFQGHTILSLAASLQVIPQMDGYRTLDAYLILLSVDGYPEEHRSLAVFLQPALAEEEQNLH